MELPQMPANLKEHIMSVWTKNCKGKGQAKEEKYDLSLYVLSWIDMVINQFRCPQLRMVWVSCGGETAADEENLGGVSYTPWRGFPGYYYPYLNQMHYLSPIVWLQFRNITPGVLIQIRSGKIDCVRVLGVSNTCVIICDVYILFSWSKTCWWLSTGDIIRVWGVFFCACFFRSCNGINGIIV